MLVKGMAHFCGFIKLIFLLLMLARIPFNESRPLKQNAQTNSDLIAGNEFLKLFMEHDQLERDLISSEAMGDNNDGNKTATQKTKRVAATLKKEEQFDKKLTETGKRSSSSRSLQDKGPKLNHAEGQLEDSKQVVKLVTSGSKIVFLEDYDENDAILDAEVRDIDLKKEIFEQKPHPNLDEYKVVAVSVSSSSQRDAAATKNRFNKFERRPSTTTSTSTSKPFVMAAPKKITATTIRTQSIASSSLNEPLMKTENIAADNFINRSHKSEFSIEEVEPLTMTQQQARKIHTRHRKYPPTHAPNTSEVLDSENSASTNIHNILAAPIQTSALARSTSTVTSNFHSGQRNMTINHHEPNLHVTQARHKNTLSVNTENKPPKAEDLQQQQQQQHIKSDGGVSVGGGVGGNGDMEDQLLPFQTVIYHDTKAGHGPQSRSISYSSISQNVEDLKKWHQSGILAEARRNVSESLKPMPKFNASLTNEKPEPAKFYSQPSKMYSEPSKFYSEPAKVYSEPAKVYGEPEKFYSEPAKVYGQPSKFYSEPSKVYSQPAKVYSEPAKVYWPILGDTTTTSTQNSSPVEISMATTAATPISVNLQQSSRKPAIVSRIAFGEAHFISSTTSSTTTTTTTNAPLITASKTYGSHSQHQYSRTDLSHRKALSSLSSSFSLNNQNSSLSSSSTPSRRILFNLDRLPYDLLNAPEPSTQQQQLLELQKSKRPQQPLTYQQQLQQQTQEQQQQQQQQNQHNQKQKQRHHINPCLESAVSSLFSSSTLSAHPALQKQQQQHSLLPDQQQHSNQNAKGLPNGDLVKCVAAISHTSATDTDGDDDTTDDRVGGAAVLTTERTHIEELFAPTPEGNYEIEESVSVMTNGRANSGSGGRNSLAHSTTSPVHQQQHYGFKPNRQRTRIQFGTNVNNPTEIRDDGHKNLYNINVNSNANTKSNNNNQRNHNAPEYNQYDDDDDANNNDNDDGNKDNGNDGAAKNNDYEDDGSSPPAKGKNGNSSDEDSKVAYIVEGHNYRKYRVEEETDDGFIVGEYGVVDHNDGNLRGVRYTADSTINRSLIQKALLTFLKLK